MRLSGVLFYKNMNLRSARMSNENSQNDFHDRLEEAFILLCKELGISVPIWLEKNTKELAMCKKTSFYEDQFSENFPYDRFELRIDRI
jgi:hypothetical protein